MNLPEAVARVKGDSVSVPDTCCFCKGEVKLVNNAEFYKGREYGCPLAYCCSSCGARVGCHPGTDIPLGTLADGPTMQARREAHDALDRLWRGKTPWHRSQAYKALAKAMGVRFAHISWMDVQEQRRRFKERRAHPLKQWKLSPIDMASLDKWDDYTRAKEAMFLHCDTSDSPWTVIKSDCKKRARLNAMRYLLHRLPYSNKDVQTLGSVDPLIVGRPALVSSPGDDQLASAGNG